MLKYLLMRVFAIADPHLSRAQPKPMTIFGENWAGHPEAFFERWREVVCADDLVLIPGDISWAMRLADALQDLHDIAQLPGQKVLLRGNHDYWWPSISKLRRALPEGMYAVQNDALRFGNVIVAGTRGWTTPGSAEFGEQDEKIYQRELERLRLSLDAAKKLEPTPPTSSNLTKTTVKTPAKTIVMLHYPPTNLRLEPSGFTDLLRDYAPDALVFGHLHGSHRVLEELDGIAVHFVAADALAFKPRLILDADTHATDLT